jgi:hypothetical protein
MLVELVDDGRHATNGWYSFKKGASFMRRDRPAQYDLPVMRVYLNGSGVR